MRISVKFLLVTGMRVGECIASFNMVIQLSKQNRLSEYYDETLSCLQHFKFENIFVRRTKAVYISFIDKSLINAIDRCLNIYSQAASSKSVNLMIYSAAIFSGEF
jgi:hypothetical protein